MNIFSGLTKLKLIQCDFPTIKKLVESRRFDSIKIEPDISENLDDIIIDAEELELCDVPLQSILKTDSIKTNLLIAGYRSRNVSDNLLSINIRFIFRLQSTLIITLQSYIPISRKFKVGYLQHVFEFKR